MEQASPVTTVPRRQPSAAWLLAPLAIATSLNFLYLDRKSFWIDEIYSYVFATAPLPEFWKIMSESEANMSLYYGILRLWVFFGDSPFWIRSLSALLGVAVVVSIYALATRLFDRRTGLIAALLAAINPFVVAYAQEARAYALLILLAVASNWLLVRALETERRRLWVAYAAVTSLAVYSHLFGALIIVAHGVWLLPIVLRERPALLKRRLLMTVAIIAILVSPLALFVLTNTRGQLAWVPTPGLWELGGFVATMAGNKWVLLSYAPPLLLGLISAIRERGWKGGTARPWYSGLILVWLFVPVGIVFALSQLKPVFIDRYLIASVPATIMLCAFGLTRLRRRVVTWGLLILICALTVPQLVHYYRAEKADWRGATAHVLAHARPGDAALFFVPAGRYAFAYYRAHIPHKTATPDLVDAPDIGESDAELVASLRTQTDNHRRLWLVLGHIRPGNHQTSVAIQDVLGSLYSGVDHAPFYDVNVSLYYRAAPSDSSAAASYGAATNSSCEAVTQMTGDAPAGAPAGSTGGRR